MKNASGYRLGPVVPSAANCWQNLSFKYSFLLSRGFETKA